MRKKSAHFTFYRPKTGLAFQIMLVGVRTAIELLGCSYILMALAIGLIDFLGGNISSTLNWIVLVLKTAIAAVVVLSYLVRYLPSRQLQLLGIAICGVILIVNKIQVDLKRLKKGIHIILSLQNFIWPVFRYKNCFDAIRKGTYQILRIPI